MRKKLIVFLVLLLVAFAYWGADKLRRDAADAANASIENKVSPEFKRQLLVVAGSGGNPSVAQAAIHNDKDARVFSDFRIAASAFASQKELEEDVRRGTREAKQASGAYRISLLRAVKETEEMAKKEQQKKDETLRRISADLDLSYPIELN